MSDRTDEVAGNKAKLTAERARYMAHEIDHHTYYLWLSDWLGLPDRLIPFSAESIATSTDPYLNDRPLAGWDQMDGSVRSYANTKGIPWSLSDTVCCLKAMAKRRRDKITPQERFAKEHGIDADRVNQIMNLARECGKLNEKYCNGDPHPQNPTPEDKSRNMELWGNAVDVAAAELLRKVQTYGFTEVAFTGLYPCLKRGDQFIELPY